MSVVTLVSGGLDSTLMALLTQEAGLDQYPLFIDYGQRSRNRELAACERSMRAHGLPEPKIAALPGFGNLIRSGLTDERKHVMEDAFTPGRNLLFLLIGASYGYTVGAEAVSIGLLDEKSILFPDQTSKFLSDAGALLGNCLGCSMKVLAPLRDFTKRDVVRLALEKGIEGTYSCHAGDDLPCGVCVACREYQFEEE
jgi:7-cyano-7-deazaguanine synthase